MALMYGAEGISATHANSPIRHELLDEREHPPITRRIVAEHRQLGDLPTVELDTGERLPLYDLEQAGTYPNTDGGTSDVYRLRDAARAVAGSQALRDKLQRQAKHYVDGILAADNMRVSKLVWDGSSWVPPVRPTQPETADEDAVLAARRARQQARSATQAPPQPRPGVYTAPKALGPGAGE